jgi:hypothetical protein
MMSVEEQGAVGEFPEAEVSRVPRRGRFWTILDKIVAALIKLPLVGAVLQRMIPRGFLTRIHSRRVWELASRAYMETRIIPILAGSGGIVLQVGTDRYTCHYPALFERYNCVLHTVDSEPAVAVFGAPGNHLTADFLKLDECISPGTYSAVILSGVFGYGINDRAGQDQALRVCARILSPGGTLVLGWNTNLVDDPLSLPAAPEFFAGAPGAELPVRIGFSGETTIYDFMVLKNRGVAEIIE